MNKKFRISILLVLALILSACGPTLEEPAATEAPEEPSPAQVEYDADYAKEVCGDRPVDSFDPQTGEVECARWEPTVPVAAQETEEDTSTEDEVVDEDDQPAVTGEVASDDLPREGDLFETPVECEDSFNEASSWLICEPGVLLDATAAFVIPSTNEPWMANVPEGGFTYFSMGEGVITIDEVSLVLPGEEGLNYLVVIRGRIDDTIVDSDLNETAVVTEFVPGHGIWSIMPPGAYVSMDWFREQLVVSTTTGGTNCGATGCSRTRVVLFDVDSHLYQMFETSSEDIDTWRLLESN